MVSCRIDDVNITPNPVNTGKTLIISVKVTDIIPGILTADGCYLETADGMAIGAEVPQGRYVLAADGQAVLTENGENIEFL